MRPGVAFAPTGVMMGRAERVKMAFWNKSNANQTEPSDAAEALTAAIRAEMPGTDEDTVRIVSAVAGLLAAVAWADRVFDPAEVQHIRKVIGQINGMTPPAQNAICGVLSRHLSELSTLHTHGFARDLKELTERDVRLEILDVLVDLAAADDEISLPEVNMMRQLTTSLGLTQPDYNASQERYREKLASNK